MEQVKLTWRDLVKDFFGINQIEDEIYDEIKDSELLKIQKEIDEIGKKFSGFIVNDEKISNNGGSMKKKYHTPTIEVKEMSPKRLEEMKNKLSGSGKDEIEK